MDNRSRRNSAAALWFGSLTVRRRRTGGTMMNRIRTTLRRDAGASAVEYGLLIAAVAAVIAGVVFLLGGKVKTAFSQACTSISTPSSTC